MTAETIAAKREKIENLRAELEAAEKDLKAQENKRDTDPVGYLGTLIYANKMSGGSYGYNYGEFGAKELERAAQVLDIVGGDVDIAARVITELHIR